MKKNILLIILFSFFLVPLPAKAFLPGPNECCKLERDLTAVDKNCALGEIVGPSHPKWCDVDGDGEGDTITATTTKWATCCFLDSVYTISDWLFLVFLAFTLIIFGIAGYLFLFSGGEPAKIDKSRNYLFWGSIALALVLLSKLIPSIIKAIVA